MAYSFSVLENGDIGEYVRKAENDFTSGTTRSSKYVDLDIYEDINTIYAYLDSKHISGPTDSQGRDKPFFNIVLAARNVWYRSTDIDRKNIKIRATKKKEEVPVFLANVKLQEWMRREDFGTFLNAWGINSAGFNETVVKFVEKDGRLIPSVVPWNRIICDVVNFEDNPKIETIELSEAQLKRNKSYDPEMVKALCDAKRARELTDRTTKDNKSDYVKLYEVHGMFPLSWLTGKESDEEEYVQQMHVVTFLASSEKGKFNDYTLYAGKESKDPYMLTALLPEIDGSIALKGSVKTLFDAQWMENHTAKTIKDQLDIASLLLFQTSDPTFVGQNVLNALQNGDILIHKPNEPLTQINNKPDIGALQSFGEQWKRLSSEIAGISETMLGQTPPSGTAWRQVNALLQESHSLFELMTENKGLAIEAMLRKFVFPFLKKKLDTTDEISDVFDSVGLEKLDAKYIRNQAIEKSNKIIREMVLRGMPVTRGQQLQLQAQYAEETRASLPEGNQRFFKPSDLDDKTWKDVFKDMEWMPEVDVTNENLDINIAATMQTILQFLAAKQGVPMTSDERFVFNKLLMTTGAVSPIELSQQAEKPPITPQVSMQPNPNAVQQRETATVPMGQTP